MRPGTRDVTLQPAEGRLPSLRLLGTTMLELRPFSHFWTLHTSIVDSPSRFHFQENKFTDKIIKGFETVTGNIKGSGVFLSQALSLALAPCLDAGGGP